MKRASVLRACAIIGTVFSVLACSESNPTVPPGVAPSDGSPSERGLVHIPDTAQPATEAGIVDASSPRDLRDAPSIAEVASVIDGATDASDGPPASKVRVTIQSPAAVSGVDGGGSADGGNTSPPVIANTDRLAPTGLAILLR